MMTNPPDLPFIHLRARSAYSLLRGGMHVKDLVTWAAQHNMPALGLTDEMNLFGSLEFSEYAVQAGVQPILGLTLPIYIPAERSELQRKKPAYIPSLALFAQNEEGREHLMRLSSLAYLQHGNEAHIHVTLEELSGLNGGLIVLTGGPSGPIDHALRNGQQSQAQQICARLKEFFRTGSMSNSSVVRRVSRILPKQSYLDWLKHSLCPSWQQMTVIFYPRKIGWRMMHSYVLKRAGI